MTVKGSFTFRVLVGLTIPSFIACRTSTNSDVSGVPTSFFKNQSIDLTRFTDATLSDYHKMVLFLNQGYDPLYDSEYPLPVVSTFAPTIEDYVRPLDESLKSTFPDATAPMRRVPVPELFAVQRFYDNAAAINERLWQVTDPKKRILVEGIVKSAAAGLNKLPNFVGPVYFAESTDAATILKRYKPNSVVVEDRFIPASFSSVGWGNVQYIIHSKTGKRVDWLVNSGGEVLFAPGHHFFVHSVTKKPGVPTSWNPSPPGQIEIDLEQIFPDFDSKDCCSLDERYDDDIKACRYRYSKTNGTRKIPYKYSNPTAIDTTTPSYYEASTCHSMAYLNISDWQPKSLCGDPSCYSGFQLINGITDDLTACRKGKKFFPEVEFLLSCVDNSDGINEVPALNEPGDTQRRLTWDAYEFRLNYETNLATHCGIKNGTVTLTGVGVATKLRDLKDLATEIGEPKLGDPDFWLEAKGLAAELREQEPVINRSVDPSIKEAHYILFRTTKNNYAVFSSRDFDIGGEPNSIAESSYADPSITEFSEAVRTVCKAMVK